MGLLDRFSKSNNSNKIKKDWTRAYSDYSNMFDSTSDFVKQGFEEFNVRCVMLNKKRDTEYVDILYTIYKDLSNFSIWQMENIVYKSKLNKIELKISKHPRPVFEGKISLKIDSPAKQAERLLPMFEQAQTKYSKHIALLRKQLKYSKLAIEAINVYEEIFRRLSDGYNTFIADELEAIMAFLYADGIREKIKRRDKSDEVSPSKITNLKGGKQNIHYTFVYNTYRLYSLAYDIITSMDFQIFFTDLKAARKRVDELTQQMLELSKIINYLKYHVILSA